ncbi:hypothetical protein CLAFUW4_12731 [Fulvia fulva]|uniref:Uncharacterized protein n=1 Tax=Passalora fulva TaxID=5499 RepID=A0A9Q8UV41_PASFU|nr:uncharacterized protein CLAFUR5_12597 [Fulvia fulva]KAK4612225.1 hypothetical protein CLAFUR4_12735 [Fulvia fulva]KAK4612805.1 hypothetical protein CLAFUR0_12742 [Fulvia fulva]UJO23457.1 hypothetical protein CLAFUR5_12597 [Fulvia fulva]WPV21160.1 hypothetical protein CLAFUW4_12731 [Fulvia fulva]WPV36521.1 hypothetical protein CLAFUW7_12738 [Fulvia fulva]
MAPINTKITNANANAMLPTRVSDAGPQQGRHHVQTPERFEHPTTSSTAPPTSPLSSMPYSSPLNNRAKASTDPSAPPLSSYLNTTSSADTILTRDWDDIRNDAMLIVASQYTREEALEVINKSRAEITSTTGLDPPLPPITTRQLHQKVSTAITIVANRNNVQREIFKAAFEKARKENGYYSRPGGRGDGLGYGDGDEDVKSSTGRKGKVRMKVNEAGGSNVARFRMVVDRMPVKRWGRRKVVVRSFTGGAFGAEVWEGG